MSRRAIIVQARMNSTRLPGKVLLRIAGRTILDHVLTRCMAVQGIDSVVCATVSHTDCDPIAAEAARLGAVVFRGSEDDVLSRFIDAAEAVNAAVVMRITSDCPLIDAEVCSAVFNMHAESGADYACNNLPHSWPLGLDCEVFTLETLRRADAISSTSDTREHATRTMRRDDRFTRISLLGPGGVWNAMRWTLDTEDDLRFFQTLLPQVTGPNMTTAKLGAFLRQHPEIGALNTCQESNHLMLPAAATRPYTDFMAPL